MWGDDNDEEFLRAIEESRKLYEEVEIPRLSQRDPSPVTIRDVEPRDDEPRASTSSDFQASTSRDGFKRPSWPPPSYAHEALHNHEDSQVDELYDGPEAEGFDFKAGRSWIYPTSDKFPVRTYQRSIVEKALFNNTLVCLPTGLGKTFIAAVVMYNYYMWYPKGKIIFMAPTKPLVAQQIENCINIMGIPASDTAEMTGATHSKVRAVTWKDKRVFFLTPQCVQNDLSSNVCPANAVKCVVIDEAHRALGDHAYAQVIRLLNSYDVHYRVLALSATPGSDLEAVQKVVTNLMINHIELRSEESDDIVQYTHQRNVELMVVDVGPTINRIKARYVAIGADYATRLHQKKFLFGNFATIPKFTILKEWEQFRNEVSRGMDPSAAAQVSNDFALVHSLSHGLELLQTYGLRLLLKHLKGLMDKNDSTANRLSVNEDLRSLMEDIETHLNPVEIDEGNSNSNKSKKCIYGHPKLDRLQEVILSHFENFELKGSATRAIVFCEYREGVIEICDMLKNFEPLVKPVVFMGQSAAKGAKGISQKQQLEIMEKFKKGVYNTLISTSVGEEGLDIGEVDLIICFDAKNSPIRQVQRMGRTGRKREGRIIMLVTRGKEEQKYNQGLHKKRSVSAVLLNRENLAGYLFEDCPKMLPPGIQPEYEERSVVQTANKPKSNQQDLRKMFAKRVAGNSSGSSKSSPCSRQLGKVPYLSEGDLDDLKLIWNVPECCKFDRIPDNTEFWTKSSEELSHSEISSRNIDLANYVEFVRYPQRTHVIGNSSDSKLLSELLMWSDDRRENEQGTMCGALSSQITSSQIWPTKQKKRGRPATLGPKATNPPKKRGRPRKEASINVDSPARGHDNLEDGKVDNQLIKPKRPQFIEDDEEFQPDLPQEFKPSSSLCLMPPSKSATSSQKNNCLNSSEDDIVIIESDDEDDINCSASSGYGYLSSEPTRQELYSNLSKALRNQPIEEVDDCIICDNLFPCCSLNKLVMNKKKKIKGTSWKDVNNALENVLKFLPQLTNEMIAQHSIGNYKSEFGSQDILSLVPKLEIGFDDEMNGGLMCGGMGDLSPPAILPSSCKNLDTSHNKSECSPGTADVLQAGFFESSDNNFFAENENTPAKNSINCEDSLVKREFEDSFDFLGLSKIDDIFDASQGDNKEVEVNLEACDKVEEKVVAVTSPVKPQELKSEQGFDFLGLSEIDDMFDASQENKDDQNFQVCDKVKEKDIVLPQKLVSKQGIVLCHTLSPRSNPESSSMKFGAPSKPKEESTCDTSSPSKMDSDFERPGSPILCSQVDKKPRFGLRLRKQSSHCENTLSNVPRVVSKDSARNTIKKMQDNSARKRLTPEDEIVTSSCQPNTALRYVSPPNVNFDLFDESLFPLSGEDNGNTSTVDESLKEAIRNKAIEAKAKQPDITFTQELKEMCETTMGGLTQMLDLFDSKTKSKSPVLKVERADSSLSPKETKASTSPAMTDDELNVAKLGDDTDALWGSEEDLFADCDEGNLYRADSSVSISSKPAALENKNGIEANSVPVNTSTCNNGPLVISRNEDLNVKSTVDEGDIIGNCEPVADNCERSLSPVFKPSQVVKKPSKLSLKKKKADSVSSTDLGSIKKLEKSANEICRNTLENKMAEKRSPKQSDLCSQIDFSMFGDEFNNSWLHSQDSNEPLPREEAKETDKCDSHSDATKTFSKETGLLRDESRAVNGQAVLTPNEECDNLSVIAKASTKLSTKFVSDARMEHNLTRKVVKERPPDNEFDVAFLKLDAARNEQKKSVKRLSCSTPKSKTKIISTNTREQLMTGPRALGKRQGPDEIVLSSSDDESIIPKLGKEKAPLSMSSEEVRNGLVSGVKPDLGKKRKRSVLQSSSSNDSFTGNGWLCAKTNKLPRKENHVSSNSRNDAEKISDIITLSSSDDENPVPKIRKEKKSLNISTSSSEESFRAISQNESIFAVDKKRKLKALQSSSSNESLAGNKWLSTKPSKAPRRESDTAVHSNKNSSLNLSSFCDASLLNELEDEYEAQVDRLTQAEGKENIISSDDDFQKKNDRRTIPKDKKKKQKRRKKANCFIVSEAEESDDNLKNSSDGESTSLDELDSSFIDNDSQPEASQSVVDIHAKYLQSVRSPAAALGRFKMPNRLPQMNMDVYSQYPDASEMDQTYANDSFCVDEATQYENPEMSLLEIAEAKLKARKRGKNKSKKSLKYEEKARENSEHSADSEGEIKVKKKRLRRIKVLEESISEDDQAASVSHFKVPTNKDVVERVENSKAVNNSMSSRNEMNQNKNDDLAQLFDDDLDFNVVPEFSTLLDNVSEKTVPPKSTNTLKFVKKVPFALKECSDRINSCSTGQAYENSTTMLSVKPASFSNASSNSTKFPVTRTTSTFNPTTSTAIPTATSNQLKTTDARPPSQIFIIASSRQIAYSTDMLRVLRIDHHVHIVPRPVPDADFIASWRLGVSRVFVSDLKDRKKLEDLVKKLKLSFTKPFLIVERDRIKTLATSGYKKKNKLKGPPPKVVTDSSSSSPSPWTSASCCNNVAFLRQSGVNLLFSQNKDESAEFLAKLARKEIEAGHGIPKLSQDWSDEVEGRLMFFTSLPGINLAFALKLLAKFPTLSEFFGRCSSVRDIATNLGVDVNAARKIHNVLCEVHVSP